MSNENTSSAGGADDLDLFEAEATGTTVSKKKEESKTIPDKYAGKTVDDLISMHQNAERLIARQGQEAGTLRRLADQILDLKKPTTPITEERKPVTVDALLNDPEAAIASAVAASDVGQRAERAENRVHQLEMTIGEQKFTAKHKNVSRDIEDPEFQTWVNKNSLRQALASSAAKEGDPNRYVAANNLWDMWDEYKELKGTASGDNSDELENSTRQQTQTKKVPNTVRQAPIDHARTGEPNWSRAKLMELRMKVQDGNEAAIARWKDPGFQERMHKAYQDKRVV